MAFPWMHSLDGDYVSNVVIDCCGCNDKKTLESEELLQIGERLFQTSNTLRKERSCLTMTVPDVLALTLSALQDGLNAEDSVYLSYRRLDILTYATDIALDHSSGDDDIQSLTAFRNTLSSDIFPILEFNSRKKKLAVSESTIGKIATFLKEYASVQQRIEPKQVELSVQQSEKIIQQMTSKFEAIRTTTEDEKIRRQIVKKLTPQVRRCRVWNSSNLEVYGSSLSLFGTTDSDIDICLVTGNGNRLRRLEDERSNAARIRDECGESCEEALKLLNIHKRICTNISKMKDGASKLADELKDVTAKLLTHGDEKRPPKLVDKQKRLRKNIDTHDYFLPKLTAFEAVVSSEIERTKASHDPSLQRYKKLEANYQEHFQRERKERKKLFQLQQTLKDGGATKIVTVPFARVPVIKFVVSGEFHCDMCIDNELAVHNTQLLRLYAALDDRARLLGCLVKYWAKSRAINDSTAGTFSSYTYVVLVIHFLQRTSPQVLPFLQDEALIGDSERKVLRGVDVTFCRKYDAARESIVQSAETAKPISQLLAEFFHYFTYRFNYVEHVASIKSKAEYMAKQDRWGLKARSWRFSVEDPFDVTRDLGCVLNWNGQQKVMAEFQRACDVFQHDGDFDILCENPKPVPTPSSAEPAKAKGKKPRKNKRRNKNKKLQANTESPSKETAAS